MIGRIKGKLTGKSEHKAFIDVGGICYEVYISKSVSSRLENELGSEVDIAIYHYFHLDKNKAIPVMIGFLDELEKEFFEVFTSVSGVGPKLALKAFDRPVSLIAKAIEGADVSFLTTLAGIGKQKAKQIVAYLQGKVGRFALIKGEDKAARAFVKDKKIIQEAKTVLKRLQYSAKEIESMINRVKEAQIQIDSVEDLLNAVYKSRG